MKIEQIEWTQGCCGEAYKWSEVQVPSGWLRIKEAEGGYSVTQFDTAKQLVHAERFMTHAELEALL